jgi:hypothetical protein
MKTITVTVTIAIFMALTTFGLKAQLNQVSLDFGRNTFDPPRVINQTSLSYARSISKNERHLLEGGLNILQLADQGAGLIYALYRYRFDYSPKWDFSVGLGYNQVIGDDGGFIPLTTTMRYNLTQHTSLRLRALGIVGFGDPPILMIPSLGLSYRWPKPGSKPKTP